MDGLSLPRVLLFTGAATWLIVGLATVLTAQSNPLLPAWALATVIFITSFVWAARKPTPPLSVLAAQSISVITMVALLCNGYEGFLLVLVAAQLALHGNLRVALPWIAVQTIALAVAISIHWSLRPALLLAPPYLGFQLIMFVGVRLFVEERQIKNRLSEANESLRRFQAELAQNTRLEERLRISQDLHDVLGHHLTALTLNLELAAHESHGAVRTVVCKAQALARALLQDVKALVRSTADDSPVDLLHELRQLARELPNPVIHLDCPAQLSIASPAIGRALLRVSQEVITNAIRHGDARNVWIAIKATSDGVNLTARDDGQAGPRVVEGIGLSGMRRRLEDLGGSLTAAPSVAGGFEVRASVPVTSEQAA